MAAYYADTSVLVKRHVPETGSAWVRALVNATPPNLIITTQLSLVELYSALNRRVRTGAVTPPQYQSIVSVINVIWPAQYDIIYVSNALLGEAKLLLEQHPLRAYDAVQLASALRARNRLLATGAAAPIFLSADTQLLAAAKAEGLATDNPNWHP